MQFSASVYEHCAGRPGMAIEAAVDVAFFESAAGIVHVIRKRKGKEVLL